MRNGGGFKANKHAVIKCGQGYKLLSAVMKQVTGAGETTVQPKPSSRELDPISAELEYQQRQPKQIVFGVKVLGEKPITSGFCEQTVADMRELRARTGQSADGDSNPKGDRDFIKHVHPEAL